MHSLSSRIHFRRAHLLLLRPNCVLFVRPSTCPSGFPRQRRRHRRLPFMRAPWERPKSSRGAGASATGLMRRISMQAWRPVAAAIYDMFLRCPDVDGLMRRPP